MTTDAEQVQPYDNGGVLPSQAVLAVETCLKQPGLGAGRWRCLRTDPGHLGAAHGGETK